MISYPAATNYVRKNRRKIMQPRTNEEIIEVEANRSAVDPRPVSEGVNEAANEVKALSNEDAVNLQQGVSAILQGRGEAEAELQLHKTETYGSILFRSYGRRICSPAAFSYSLRNGVKKMRILYPTKTSAPRRIRVRFI